MAAAKRKPLTQRDLLIEAGQALHGKVDWMTKFAATIDVSKQLISAMVAEKPTRLVSKKTEVKVVGALVVEAERLRKVANRLDAIAALIALKRGSENG